MRKNYLMAGMVTVLSWFLVIGDSIAVPAETAKAMCEEFHKDKASDARQTAIAECLRTITIDSPQPQYPSAGGASWARPIKGLWDSLGTSAEAIGALAFVAVIYFIPAFVAYIRKKVNRAAILILNIFLGWTFVGWVLALVWAATYDQPRRATSESSEPLPL